MFMPAVFHENLFDDLFDPFWNDGALERAMNREERETSGNLGAIYFNYSGFYCYVCCSSNYLWI